MASILRDIIVLCLMLVGNCDIKVKWFVSNAHDKCLANDTLSGTCVIPRNIQCVKEPSGQIVPDYYCNRISTKPASFLKCDKKLCPGRCVVSMWSSWQPCDAVCSREFTYRTRNVLWRDKDDVACPALIEKMPCAECVGNANEFFSWKVGDWGACRAFTMVTVYKLGVNQSYSTPSGSNLCGPIIKIGKASRAVKCVDRNGVEVESDKCLNSKDKDGRITQLPEPSKVCQLPCDCHVSPWSSWSGCSDCSRTEESRTRGVLYPAQLNGNPCGNLFESRTCTNKCSYTWYNSSWGECRVREDTSGTRCGDGAQERVVFCIDSNPAAVIQPVSDSLCNVTRKPVARRRCRVPCPQDCMVSSWSAWEPCSISCGGAGMKRRVRSVIQLATNGGKECPALVQMSPCEAMPCAMWQSTPWSFCIGTSRCGAGMLHRVTYCAEMPAKRWADDKLCATTPAPQRTMNCTVPCPNDCTLSRWGVWSPCSRSCGVHGGVQTRKRSILAPPSPIRPPCPGNERLTETQKCNVGRICEEEAAFMWKTTAWSTCKARANASCGVAAGLQSREVNCGNELRNFANVTKCKNMSMPDISRPCDVPCPRDCVVSKWSSWSQCNATCQTQGM